MADGSTIEWLQRPGTKPATWNPIIAWREVGMPTGGMKRLRGWHCEHVHEGCVNCYSETQNKTGLWMGTKLPYKPGHRADVEIELREPTLLQPLKWKSPRTIFVCSMTDLYGEWVTDEWLDKIKAVQALTPQHTYIELTKRPERMRDYHKRMRFEAAGEDAGWAPRHLDQHAVALSGSPCAAGFMEDVAWPLKNVWGLVSCSTQDDADAFIPILLQTPLAVRGVSLEPLLGPIDLKRVRGGTLDVLIGHDFEDIGDIRDFGDLSKSNHPPGLDWVIAGGESGSEARPMHPQWVRDLQKQCAGDDVPFFFKQWGEWGEPLSNGIRHLVSSDGRHIDDRQWDKALCFHHPVVMSRVGKKAAGRLLDGVTHDGYPQVSA